MAYNGNSIDDGSLIGGNQGTNQTGSAIAVDDSTSQQITEISGGDAIAVGTPTGNPLLDSETVYRKRLVKVVNGKMVDTKPVYIERYMIAKSGGYGDGYQFLVPAVSGGVVTFTPAEIELP